MRRLASAVSLVLLCWLACARREVRDERPAVHAPDATGGSGYSDGEKAALLAEGKRLYQLYNCSACHGHGSGGMGPALLDDVWIYGDSPTEIHVSIIAGRPRGMPAYGQYLSDAEAWKIVAYVESLRRR
jgi:cytochrome c oxidase cbb3-type subunit 3